METAVIKKTTRCVGCGDDTYKVIIKNKTVMLGHVRITCLCITCGCEQWGKNIQT